MSEAIKPEANRQLPIGGEVFLDHVAHFVRDRDAAAKAIARAGFAPTPVSIQTNPGPNGTSVPAGTGNVTAMMTRGYLEFLFKTADTPLTREFDDLIGRYPGVHLMAFVVSDAKAASDRLARTGFRTQPLVALRRPVATETGEAEAAFTVARVEPGQMREGRVQFLTHHTEDAVWQKRWLVHPNGAHALIDAVVAVADVYEATARFARFLGREPARTAFGQGFFLDRGGVQIVNAAGFAQLLPAFAIPAFPFIGAYGIGVDSLAKTEAALRAGGLAAERHGPMLVAGFPAELGLGAWIFVERAADLPWRRQT
jgi:hypothetical protein